MPDNTMRDKVAKVIACNGLTKEHRPWLELLPETRRHYMMQSDAVLATLPDMIAPLVWRNSFGVLRAENSFGEYKVCGSILTLPLPMNPQQVHTDTLTAKAAANAHHRATIIAAFGEGE